VSGNGQREIAELILGLRRLKGGTMRLWGEEATGWSVARMRECGVASIPDDPLGLALIPGMTVRENLALGSFRRYPLGLGLDWPRLAADMEKSLARLRFPPLSYAARAAALSGAIPSTTVGTPLPQVSSFAKEVDFALLLSRSIEAFKSPNGAP
jgi:ABC-type uncharacterized transport system ATPase subunit